MQHSSASSIKLQTDFQKDLLERKVPHRLDFAILGTGSKSNCYLFSDGFFSFLIDDGFSRPQTVARLRKVGYEPTEIQAIFVTHDHIDHIRGVREFSKKYRIPVYGNPLLNWGGKSPYQPHPFQSGELLQIEGLSILAFSTYHDAAGAQGYHFSFAGKRFTLITDTGIYSPEMVDYAADSDFLFLEANYSEQALREGCYPDFLKRRISSKYGHLSNDQACDFLNALEKKNHHLSKIFFCHLSENNNSPQLLESCLKANYLGNVEYIICPRGLPVLSNGKVLELDS